ncbi:restriction endonuclease subunit S [Natroniella acetigena]|uniref:restriction endonuclease subunit S n=1 Tax=Natroniella acetigena TaxID=52004 RepID=UPI00200ADA78|nr:restriction endonuclease subunit S [Natroniella acetigena]MCK8827811.1 restriction endonuclease subunit S [Natroniella acetigena]
MIKKELVVDRLDSSYYHYQYFKVEEKIKEVSTKLLKETCDVDRGRTPKSSDYSDDTGYFIIKGNNLTSKGIKYHEIPEVSEEFFAKYSERSLEKDTILISSIGTGSTGKADILTQEGKYLTVSENTILEKASEEMDMYYLVSFLRTTYGYLELLRNEKGSSGQAHLYPQDIETILIPTPSPEIQKYIGDKVRKAEKLREEAEELREKAEEEFYQIVEFDQYTFEPQKSYNVSVNRLEPYLEANYYKPKYLKFYDYLDNLEFKIKNLDEILAGKPQKSNSPAKKKRVNEGIPSLIVSDIDPYKLEVEENKISVSKEVYEEREGAQLIKNDVIFTTAGPPLGETTIVVEEALPLLHGSHVTAFRCNELCNPGYLTLVLNSKLGQIQTKRHCYGIRQKYLFNKQLYKFQIPLLPKEIQGELGNMIINSIKMEFKSKRLIEEAKQDVEDLIEGNLDIS